MVQQLILIGLTSLFLFITNFSFAEEKPKKAPSKGLHIDRTMHITYGSPSWNTDPKAIDTAYLILRDKNSGKIVQIQLEETEPDSSQFTGRFSLGIGDQEKISPEVYIPPKELRGTDVGNKKLYEMIQSGKLQRKPVIWTKNERGQSVLEVYDTREQAEKGLKAYEEEQRLGQELRRKQPLKPATNEAAAAAVARQTYMEKLALEAARKEQERVRLEQIEKQKVADRAEQLRKMSEGERAKRRARAAQLANDAGQHYAKEEFEEAEAKFRQAVDLDPDNKDYYYKYGITLYRTKKFNEALVTLKLAKVEPNLELEKRYFMGLVYYRVGDLDNAVKAFEEVGKSTDENLGPSALFYLGVTLYSQEKYEASKVAFEKVIDVSKDPHLDAQAEEYIERIAAAIAFQKLRENKFTLMAVVGGMYDSNVLLTPDSTLGGGKPSATADFRLLTTVDLQYRPIFNEKHELAPHVTANLTNSMKNDAAPADPYIFDVAAPYTYKGTAFKKSYRGTATPGYEDLYMDPTKSGTKTRQISSYFLTLDNTFTMSQTWVSTYTLEYRFDKSLDPSS